MTALANKLANGQSHSGVAHTIILPNLYGVGLAKFLRFDTFMPGKIVRAQTDEMRRRHQAIRWYLRGVRFTEICERLDHHSTWLAKWVKRYREEGWGGLRDRSRRPHSFRAQTAERTINEILALRESLERFPGHRVSIGATAIRRILLQRHRRVPSVSTIERILRRHRGERRRLDRKVS